VRRATTQVSASQALAAAGGDADAYLSCSRSTGEIAAYLELHIEQGPVPYERSYPTAAVTAIDGAVRLLVSGHGLAGHAGTEGLRPDALWRPQPR
jgi:allantoate deiminase